MAEFTLILLAVLALIFLGLGYLIGKALAAKEWETQLPKIREEAISRSRSVLTGQFSEQLAPYLPNFPFSPTEARFIGKPVDFLVFRGMDHQNIEEVIFVEVKSGKSHLSTSERRLREAIQKKKVRWAEYAVPQEKKSEVLSKEKKSTEDY